MLVNTDWVFGFNKNYVIRALKNMFLELVRNDVSRARARYSDSSSTVQV